MEKDKDKLSTFFKTSNKVYTNLVPFFIVSFCHYLNLGKVRVSHMTLKKIFINSFLIIFFTTLTLFVSYWSLELSGISVERQWWLARTKLFGLDPVGIWQDDPRLGWKHLENSTGQHYKPTDFDVTYHIDAQGHRITEASYQLPKIVFLGGSFTFGHGVEDNQNYVALLQTKFPEYKLINAAVNGWGTTQSLLKLESLLQQFDDIHLVVYGFISHHLRRNYLRKSWLSQIQQNRQRRSPYFELVDNQLVFQGLATEKEYMEDTHPELNSLEIKMTLRMIEEMEKLCSAQKIPLLLVYLPDESRQTLSANFEQIVGRQHVIDLRETLDYRQMHYQYDYHPTPQGHQQIADALLMPLKNRVEGKMSP